MTFRNILTALALSLTVAAILPACDDSGPDSGTGDESSGSSTGEHVGDGQGEDYSECINDSDCKSGDCPIGPLYPRMLCEPAPCVDDGEPDADGESCNRDSDCEGLEGGDKECRGTYFQHALLGGHCTPYDKCE